MKRLDLAANLAVLVSSVALFGFLGNAWYNSHHAPQSRDTRTRALIGTTVKLPGVDFSQKDRTLLIAISETCRFCKESHPFYRSLTEIHKPTANIIAVLPASQPDANGYVHSFISSYLPVVQTRFGDIGVSSTPTLLLVDNQGKVIKAWIGKLDETRQAEVQSML